jgi:hypothetical protein
LRDASPQLRHEIWSRSARAALPPKLGFPWIPLAESGLFNGLRRIQIKKFFPSFSPGAECIKRSSGQARAFLSAGKDIARILNE